jgi:hypothetical protein
LSDPLSLDWLFDDIPAADRPRIRESAVASAKDVTIQPTSAESAGQPEPFTDDWSLDAGLEYAADVGEAAAPSEDASPFARGSLMPNGFVEWFVVAQTAIPALLFLPGAQALRLPIRIGAYGATLVGLALWRMRGAPSGERHPAERWLWLIGLWLAIMVTHPSTSSLAGGVAQLGLYVSVFCGVFWTPHLVADRRALVRILALLLVCNGLNATVGVLQAYDPDRFMPRELSFAFSQNGNALAAATYIGANGRTIVRPPGLFDTPGAVCGPGTVAALLGLVFALQPYAWWVRLSSLALAGAGLSAIYLSQVRANLVIALAMMAVYGGLLVLQRQTKRAAAFGTLCATLLVAAFLASSLVGGDAIAKRFSTLLEADPGSLYYANRGQQLSTSFTALASEYPIGAGLARWGLMNGYFGDPTNTSAAPLWAEIMPVAWVIDGGLVLVALYAAALVATAGHQWRLVRRLPDDRDRAWAAAIVAVNVGTIALVFSFVPFTTQVGLQFWFLEGALHGAFARTVASAERAT